MIGGNIKHQNQPRLFSAEARNLSANVVKGLWCGARHKARWSCEDAISTFNNILQYMYIQYIAKIIFLPYFFIVYATNV